MPSMMCLGDNPWSLRPEPVGKYTLVKISTLSRRTPRSARPSTSSARVSAYASAVSNDLMPASSSSTWDPWVIRR
jgi:hypothetical protein